MRAFIATYYNEEQARIALDEYVSTLKEDEVLRQVELISIGPRWRLGVIIDNKQMDFDFGCSDCL